MLKNAPRERASTKKNGGSRERILNEALREFAEKGFSGARVDRIANKAGTSKHMLYYHFRSKTGLYETVLEGAYGGIRFAESNIDVDHMNSVDALRSIVRQSFDYHCDHEMFVRLVMNENIHHANHIDEHQAEGNRAIIDILADILQRGSMEGSFRSGIDPKHLHLTISALGFHFVSNRYSFAKIFEMDLESPRARQERRELVVETVLSWVAAH